MLWAVIARIYGQVRQKFFQPGGDEIIGQVLVPNKNIGFAFGVEGIQQGQAN